MPEKINYVYLLFHDEDSTSKTFPELKQIIREVNIARFMYYLSTFASLVLLLLLR